MPVPRAPTDRFGDRVGDYLRHCPGCPEALRGWLLHAPGVATAALVADVGGGSGQSARMWLDSGHDGLRRVKGTAGAPTPADAGMAGLVVPGYDTRAFIGTLD